MKNLVTGIKYSIIILTVWLYSSCNNNKIEPEIQNDFRGEYKITGITSSEEIDLNNDGIKSNNYYAEFQSNYVLRNGETLNFGWDLNERGRFAVARPTETNGYKIQFLDINFPQQTISPLFVGNDTFVNILMEYRAMTTWLIYILEDGQVRIDPNSTQDFEFYGMTDFKINRLDKQTFQIKFNLNIYDFADKVWVNSQLSTTYKKV